MQKTVLEGLSGRAAAYVKAHKAGMDTQTFAAMYRKYWDIDQREGMTATRRANAWAAELQFAKEPNPWNVLPLQDAMSRHRGAKPPRRCGRLGEISLLSPG